MQTKGPFFHNLDEALRHIAEGHLRKGWLLVSGTRTLSELQNWTPEELQDLATKLVCIHASSQALNEMDQLPPKKHDAQKHQIIQWNHDILQYIVLDWLICHSDVGIMEDMLPHLLYQFIGGGNNKYVIDTLELMQGLNQEWLAEVG